MTPVKRDRHVILAYMDEHGTHTYTHTRDERWFLRSCLIVRENQLGNVEKAAQQVSSSFPISPNTNKRCVFHAKNIFWATGDWRPFKQDERIRKGVMHRMADVMVDQDLYVTFGAVDKSAANSTYVCPVNPHIMSFIQCGEIMEEWTEKFAPDQRWAPCAGHTEFDKELSKLYVRCRQQGPPYGKSRPLWKFASPMTPSFVDPKDTEIFLISDLCAFAFGRYKERKDDWGIHQKIGSRIWGDRHWTARSRLFPGMAPVSREVMKQVLAEVMASHEQKKKSSV